jgi:acetoin utilization deacetylase AcuC-like enzyme
LVLYQAGADTHVDDPLGGLLTTEQMRERDRIMFSVAHELGIPLAWNLAGGYQVEPDGSIPKVVQLHLNTFEEALKVWRLI